MQVDEGVEFCGRAWHGVGQKSESMAYDKVRVVTGMNMNERRGDRPLPLVPRRCQVPGRGEPNPNPNPNPNQAERWARLPCPSLPPL